ncbi:MAG: FtsX-like permease family protein [Gammaproteobacteria bacterium]|nr:FtsX-like permease family protein [Gammaproteobacteria bacterium]MYC25402.1 FtsX-like permease family protein [Gammaproteobacteria bacterium]
MKLLIRSQWRDLISRPLVLIALLANLVLALFAISVVHVAGHTLVHEYVEGQPQSAYQYVVPLTDNRESSYFTFRERWRAGELPEVVGMVPVVEGNLEISGRAIPLIGIDLVSDSQAMFDLGDAQIPTTLVTQDSVIAFGDDLANTSFPNDIKVLEFRSGEQTFLLADIATAQNLLGRTGEIDAAWLRYNRVRAWDWMEHLSPGITTGLGFSRPEISLADHNIEPMDVWQPTQTFVGSIAFNMGLLGMLAVLVSGFIVYESTARSIERRAQEFDRLQTIGVSVLQIRSVLILEASTLVLFSALVAAVVSFVFLQLNDLIRDVLKTPFLIATSKGLVLGLSTALIGVILAFNREVRKASWIELVLGVVVAVAMLCYGIWMTTTLFGAYVAVFALCVLHIVVLTPALIRLLDALLPRFKPKSLISRINVRAMWLHLKQAKFATIAFSLAIATAIGITLMVSSLRTDFFELLEARLPSGLQIREASNVDPKIIRQWTGVDEVREYFRGEGTLSVGKTNVIATSIDEYEARRYGNENDADRVGVYVNEKVAAQLRANIGDELELKLPSATPISLPIIHIFKSYGEMSRVVLLPKDQVPSNPLVRDRLLIVVQPDAIASVERRLNEKYPSATVLSHGEIRERAVRIFNRTFALTNLIALIAVMVAVIGLFNSALALQSAKNAEYRLLNTLGFSRFALFRQSFTQSTLHGGVCCLLSLPLGIGIAWILCELVNPRAFHWTISLHVAPTTLGFPLLLGLSAAVLASILPWLFLSRNPK